MLGQFGCDNTHRWVAAYQESRAPRATGLIEQLSLLGACCCDCEIFLNAYALRTEAAVPPPCSGVARGATVSCANWEQVGGYDPGEDDEDWDW